MDIALVAAGAAAFGIAVGWVLGGARTRARGAAESARLGADLAVATERAAQAREALDAQRAFLEDSRRDLEHAFRSLAATALEGSARQFLELAEQRWTAERANASRDLDARRQAIETLLAPMRETLSKLETRTTEIETARVGAYRAMEEQLRGLMQATGSLNEKTTVLATALRGSSARGRWGEIALRNVAELAGMTEHCDFEEQETHAGTRRPDMTVRLPGNRWIAVDAKVPLEGYLDSVEAADAAARDAALDRHVSALRGHVRALEQRGYADVLPGPIDLVVLFLPGDALLSAAFSRDPDLQTEALRRKVLIATPTTLVALLRTVAVYWRERRLAEGAEELRGLVGDFHTRIALFAEHLAKAGRGLAGAVESYNQAVGSFESRVRPAVRRLEELHATGATDKTVPELPPVDAAPRRPSGADSGDE